MSRSEHSIQHFDARGQVYARAGRRPDPSARIASDLRIRKWRLRAEECRAVAESMRDSSRAPLLAMAEHCERMADDIDFGPARDRD
jgi:hypothetical protein